MPAPLTAVCRSNLARIARRTIRIRHKEDDVEFELDEGMAVDEAEQEPSLEVRSVNMDENMLRICFMFSTPLPRLLE